MTKIKNNLNGLILAGGRSERMGRDKAFLDYHGKPQLEYAYDLLQGYCGQVFVSTRLGDHQKSSTVPALPDASPYEGIGPLGGMLTAMSAYPGAAWIVLACDLPFVSTATIDFLLRHRDTSKIATAFISTHDGLPEPLCAIWEPHAKKVIETYINEGIRCARKVLIKSQTRLVEQADPQWLNNINTPAEYEQARQVLKKVI